MGISISVRERFSGFRRFGRQFNIFLVQVLIDFDLRADFLRLIFLVFILKAVVQPPRFYIIAQLNIQDLF